MRCPVSLSLVYSGRHEVSGMWYFVFGNAVFGMRSAECGVRCPYL